MTLTEIDRLIKEAQRRRKAAYERLDAVGVVCAVAEEERLKAKRAKAMRENR